MGEKTSVRKIGGALSRSTKSPGTRTLHQGPCFLTLFRLWLFWSGFLISDTPLFCHLVSCGVGLWRSFVFLPILVGGVLFFLLRAGSRSLPVACPFQQVFPLVRVLLVLFPRAFSSVLYDFLPSRCISISYGLVLVPVAHSVHRNLLPFLRGEYHDVVIGMF